MNTDDKILSRLDKLLAQAEKVLATAHKTEGLGGTFVDHALFHEWRLQTQSFLENLLPRDHVYVREFADQHVKSSMKSNTELGQGILHGLRVEIVGGYLQAIRSLISADIFSDFLEMAQHLLDTGYYHPAASLAGAVLENGLRGIATKHGVKVKDRDNLMSLNQKCADANIYTRLTQRKLNVWIEIRDNADHGKFDNVHQEDVVEMINGIQDFLAIQLEKSSR